MSHAPPPAVIETATNKPVIITPNNIAPTDAKAATCPPIANITKYKTIGDNTGNNDGIIDLKKSPEDSIFTAAALISELGWKPNQPWIEEVIINDINFPWQEAGFGRNRTVSSWKKLGIISRNKKFMASDKTMATLLLPQGLKGPKFLAYPNYNIYLKWNDSFIYTVTAAHLASRLGGQKKFLSSKPEKILSVEEMLKLQKILQSKGYDVGKVDGILGRKTRQSVRSIQIKLGLPADSWPTADLFNTLN